jgi:patatin-related protein
LGCADDYLAGKIFVEGVLDMAEVPQEQIRFAVVLNGGVSLAVWMGGVVLELDRLTRDDSTYPHLLSLVGCTARADVIAGTSAGGINGAALALSQVNRNAELSRLRDLWAEQGRMEQLLRTPFQGEPVSLLKGDEFFLPRLQEALDRLTTNFEATTPDERPIDLRITTTLLGGVPTVTHDDLGQVLVQSTHQGSFSFRRDAAVDGREQRDDFAEDDLPQRVLEMALAARSSASFPFAFEPSFIPVNDKTTGKPDMAGSASWTNGDANRSRFAVDGGVLVNTPTKEALEAIDRMPAEGPVRRVMLLVFPHAEPAGTEPPAHVEGVLPTTIGTGGKLLAAMSSQSGRTYVEKIEEHNRFAASRRGGRNALLSRLASGATTGSVTKALYDLESALHGHFEDVRMRQVARDVTTWQFDVQAPNDVAWSFERVRGAAEVAQREWQRTHQGLPYVPPERLPRRLPEDGWHWGVTMAERLASVTLDLLKRLVWVVPKADEKSVADARTELHEVRAALAKLRTEINLVWTADGVAPLVPLDQAYWTGRTDLFAARMAGPDADLGRAVRTEVDRIGKIADVARKTLDALTPEQRQMGGLAPWHALLTEPPTEAEQDADVLLSRLLALEVATTCLTDDSRTGLDQPVELVQVSLQTANAFAKYSVTADDKAGGASLSRFSGFLKRSWRVNDWIWGRLDGATMLCRVVFDPQRLRRVNTLAAGDASLEDRAAQRVDALVLELFGPDVPKVLRPKVQAAKDELTAIYRAPDGDLAPSANALAELAAWGLHVRIITEELPALRQSILADRLDGADRRSRGELFLVEHDELLVTLNRPVDFGTPETRSASVELGLRALGAFDRAGIGREPLSQEAGSDQVIRTAATAAAVAITVADSGNSGLPAAKPLTRALRGAALLPYWTITGLTRGGKLAQFLGLLGFAVGGALVVLALFNLLPDWATGPAGALGTATVLSAFGYAALRSGTLLHGLVLLSPVIPLVAVAVDRLRAAPRTSVTTGMVTVGGVALVTAALLVIGSLPAPLGTPLAVLKRVRIKLHVVGQLLGAAVLVALGWLAVRYRVHELAWLTTQVVVVVTVASIVFAMVASFTGGRSLQRWQLKKGEWVTENAEPPAAATAGWAAVYGSVFLVLAAVILVFRPRFTGWEAVLGTSVAFGLVLLLVTTWLVPLRGRREIAESLVEQAIPLAYPNRAADDLMARLEGHALLYRFLIANHDNELTLTKRGRRVADRIEVKLAQAANSGTGTGTGTRTGLPSTPK